MQTIKAASAISMMRSRLYGKGRARTPLFKAITGVLAAEMTLMGLTPAVMAANLPQSSAGYGAGMNVSGQKLTIDGAQGAGSSFTWDQGFNIGQGYTVQFQNIAAAVNKDTSGQLSSILGNLFSDGAVYILNPNGILFGPSAVVDVHGLIAAAVGSVGKGPDGEFVFSKLGSGNVVNQGSISAGDFAYLVGRSVENSGSISAANVALAAFGGTGADSITIASTESGAKITFQIPEGAIAEAGEDDGGEVAVSGTITGIQNEQASANGGARRAAATTPDLNEYTDDGNNIKMNVSMYAGAVKIEENLEANNVDITATKYINVGREDGTVEASITSDNAISLKSTGGNVNIWGDLTANNGKIDLVAESAEKSVKIGNENNAVTVSATGGDITLDGNKSAQLLSGTITADGKVTMKAGEYIVVNGDVTASGDDVTLETTVEDKLTANLPSYEANSEAYPQFAAGQAAGVNVLGGTIQGANVTINSKGSIQTAKDTKIEATAGNVSLVANGASTDEVRQGIVLGGDATASSGSITLKGDNVVGAGNVSAKELALVGDSFGTSDGALSITAKTLAANVKNDIYVTKDGALTVGKVGDVTGVTAGGMASLAATGDLTVDEKISAANVTLGGKDITASGDITVNNAGTLTLNSDFTQTAGTITVPLPPPERQSRRTA